ncbi:MAG: DNA mismatch repair endonuclease MutL [Ktedonobacterales bacterium]
MRDPRHMRPIEALPREVIDRIAAGEVIERPASVVRELIDNALDAGATAIRIELRDGGLRLIRVSDDGCGIEPEELAIACQPHTTSKIHSLDDLTSITTLGFRGEALSSIAAVAELEIISARNAEGLATSLLLQPGDESGKLDVVTRSSWGTTVTVRDLFSNVPARRSLLRGPRTEAAHALSVARAYALIHPAVRFILTDDGQLILQTPGTDLLATAVSIYGSDVGRALLPFGPLYVDDAALSGLVATRSFTFPTREHVFVAINGRPITNRALVSAIESGYRPVLHKGRHPLLVANITVPPDSLDANVHPGKAEVLLRQESALAPYLRETIHHTLGNAPISATQISHPIAPTFAVPLQLHLPTIRKRRGLTLGERKRAYTPSQGSATPHDADEPAISALSQLQSLGQFEETIILAQSPQGHLYLVDQHRAHERILYEELVRQRAHSSSLPSAATAPDDEPTNTTPTTGIGQLLLEPILVELTPSQAEILSPRLAELAALGLDCQPFGGSVFLVRAVPHLPGSAQQPAAFARALTQDASEDSDDWIDHLCISLACRSAIRRGQPLTLAEQQRLLDDLRTAATTSVCPHGSPLALRYSKSFLTHAFEW